MVVGIIDADLIGRKKHRFPNLACMKLSAHHKSKGDDVELITSYIGLEKFDKIYISKVFTDTKVPDEVLSMTNVEYGGTGFYYDKAPPLPYEVEHIMPDYHLYDYWVRFMIESGKKRTDYTYYLDYSIGFLTRGCFRQCQFCVNKNYTRCIMHSHISEFHDNGRPKLCFLDDNFFACPEWKEIIHSVKELNKPFQFKQGLDERLLTDEKIHEMYTWRYDGDFIFAFDDIEDRAIIERNLNKIYEIYPKWRKHLKFYVFCGFDRSGKWDTNFFINDIRNVFERIKILSKYSAVPYIMRYETCYKSDYSGIYSSIASWCNQPNIFKKFSYKMYCQCKGMGSAYSKYKRDVASYISDGGTKGATWRYMEQLNDLAPDVSQEYFNFIPEDMAIFGVDAVAVRGITLWTK